MNTKILLAIASSLVTQAHAFYSNSSSPVDFVTGSYPNLTPVGVEARCADLNFNFKSGNHKYYPAAQGTVSSAYALGNNDYEIVFNFDGDDCPPLSNLDQAAIIGVNSPESSSYYLYDSNQKIHNIDNACSWSARFVVTGDKVGNLVCVPPFQVHYAWFSGLASSSDASSFDYSSAYEYSMNCDHDNNNNAESDFPQYCFEVASVSSQSTPASSSLLESASVSKSSLLTTVVVPSSTTSLSSASESTSPDVQSLYGQCGGSNWNGPTACVSAAVCSSMNPFYYQCVAVPTTPTTSSSSSSSIVSPSASSIASSIVSPSASSIASSIALSSASPVASSTTSSTTSLSSASESTSLGVQSLYGQCGGSNWNGPTACVSAAVCSSMNPFYYQCVAGPTPTTTSSLTTSSTTSSLTSSITTKTTATPEAFAELYGQCGGSNWNGPTACVSTAVCSSMNPFYYQCVAGPTPAITSSSSTSLTTTKTTAVPTTFAELYGQCGGINWEGATACSEGICSSMNPYYFQCVKTAY